MNLCVLASGRGSNLKAIINARKSGNISSRVVLVVSNNSASGALLTAKKNHIPSIHLSAKLFVDQSSFDKEFLSLLKKFKIDLIVLAGYMKMISPAVTGKYKNRIINIHPALLPAFGGKGMYGMNVHEAVIKAKVRITGATVHYVDDVYDNGTIILQKEVKVKPGDDAETLGKRVLRTEHKLYPEAIKLLEENKVTLRSNKVYIKQSK
ncbi:MAG: phosphoribosylglycinamide formyltransferase [Ignavibacteria bacterium]|nr:phosphoribosylglycinamide formyltransferase [Ignavibacteria bacterium]